MEKKKWTVYLCNGSEVSVLAGTVMSLSSSIKFFSGLPETAEVIAEFFIRSIDGYIQEQA